MQLWIGFGAAALDRGGGPKGKIRSTLLVWHYAVTHSLDATYGAQVARGYYAHFSIDGYHDGNRSRFRLIQQVPLDTYASHAGESSWRGRAGVGAFSIGVEFAICATLALGLRDAGYFEEMCGHSEIAPGRKFDPGPAFPLAHLRALVSRPS